MLTEIIGWGSSLLLLLTICSQVYRQWQERSAPSISKWLFLGQVAASAGFTAYSVMVHNMVFAFTNALTLCSALVGVAITVARQRNQNRTA